MEIQLDTDFLTQDEFDAVTQIKINAGVRQHLSLMRAAQKQEKSAVEKPAQRKNYTRGPRTKKGKRIMPKINPSHLRQVYDLAVQGRKPAYISQKVGLRSKTINGLVYRMKNRPSNKMVKALGKRKLAKIANH